MIDRVPRRTCATCLTAWDQPRAAGYGWTPRPHGWTCPACSRRHVQRVEAGARLLLSKPGRWWMHSNEHDHRVACLWCEVVRRATELELSG